MDRRTVAGTQAGAQARRERLRELAREQRRGRRSEVYRTPEWLDRSFVLPLARPEMSLLPHQSTTGPEDRTSPARPAHLSAAPSPVPTPAEPAAPPTVPHRQLPTVYVRPPSREIDFARVVRRADARRAAGRATLTSSGLGGVLLMAYLLTGAAGALAAALMAIVVAAAAAVVLLRLATAPIPHLERRHCARHAGPHPHPAGPHPAG